MKGSKYLDYPFLFLFIGLVFGFQFVFTNPPWHANDEDRHFYNAYALTRGIFGPQVKDSEIGQYLPRHLVESVSSFQGIRFSDSVKIRKSVLEDFKSVENDGTDLVFSKNPTSTILPIAYLPSAVGIGFGRLLEKSPIEIGWFARGTSLLAYLAIVFFALKTLPYGKPLLTVTALCPMALYQASSVSYDGMSFALIFLYFALVVKYIFSKEPLQLRNVLLLIAIGFLQRLCKEGYTILFFSALILPWTGSGFSGKSVKRNYALLIAGLLVITVLPSFLWTAYLNTLHIPKSASNSFQKDFVFNGQMNLKYHLQNPVKAVLLGFENAVVQGRDWLTGAVGRFGYSYTKLPLVLTLACWFVLAASSVFQEPRFSTPVTVTFFAVGLLNIAAIVYGFLIVGSPVGSNFIFGLQGRYFTPIIPFFFAGAFQVSIKQIAAGYLKWSLMAVISLILFYTIHFLDSSLYFSQ